MNDTKIDVDAMLDGIDSDVPAEKADSDAVSSKHSNNKKNKKQKIDESVPSEPTPETIERDTKKYKEGIESEIAEPKVDGLKIVEPKVNEPECMIMQEEIRIPVPIPAYASITVLKQFKVGEKVTDKKHIEILLSHKVKMKKCK